jgi:cyclopropane fatty-acyl-phospholipid synthase-like methyltransferase
VNKAFNSFQLFFWLLFLEQRYKDLSLIDNELPIFDWIVSLEVGEHIPKEFQDNFIQNLHRHNKEGIVLSWALPGQGGHHHVNEMTNDQVRNLFHPLGYTSDYEMEKKFREAATLGWFKNSILVFRKKH